jgi:hypothetical protein
MTRQQLIDFTVKSLTGGGLVSLDITPDLVDEALSNAFDILKPWYMETVVIESAPVIFTSNVTDAQNDPRTLNGYVELSKLSRPVNFIDTVLPIRGNYKGDYVLDEISDLVGLPAGLFSSNATREYATWITARDMIRKSMSLKLKWKTIGENLYVYKVPRESVSALSLWYFPMPQDIEEITYGPALNWLKIRFEAELKKMWSMPLLKSTTAPHLVSFATMMRTEALADITASDLALRSLQFHYINFQRA